MRLETDRLLLRPLQRADIPPLVELWSDLLATRYMGGPRERAALQRGFKEDFAAAEPATYDLWPVAERAGGCVVGHCGLLDKEVDGHLEIELVYVFTPAVWGRGYASEIGRALREYALETLGLCRLIALIEPENAASERVAQKVGMALEKEATRPGGRVMRVYALEAAGVNVPCAAPNPAPSPR